jgi:hypothetical protein
MGHLLGADGTENSVTYVSGLYRVQANTRLLPIRPRRLGRRDVSFI